MGRDGVIFGYDYENRLVSAGSAGYAYDADGIRVSSANSGSATDYLVDKNRQYAQVLEKKDGSGSVSYVHGDDLISRKRGGEVRYYVYDGHGSVRQLTDSDGTVTDSYIYDAFGNLKDHLGESDNRYLYAGEQYDPDSGLYYLRARYYDPESGRFMTHDPYRGNPDDPVTLHRYLYGNANPVMYTDPSGEFSLLQLVKVSALMGIVSNAGTFLFNQGRDIPVRWYGDIAVLTYVPEPEHWGFWGVGGISARLRSEPWPHSGVIYKGEYLIVMAGVTYGFGPGVTTGDAELEIPAMFEGHKYLQGHSSWLSLTGSLLVIPGVSWTTWNMGMAYGEVGFMPDTSVKGWDVGADIMGGISVCISKSYIVE